MKEARAAEAEKKRIELEKKRKIEEEEAKKQLEIKRQEEEAEKKRRAAFEAEEKRRKEEDEKAKAVKIYYMFSYFLCERLREKTRDPCKKNYVIIASQFSSNRPIIPLRGILGAYGAKVSTPVLYAVDLGSTPSKPTKCFLEYLVPRNT